MEEKLFQFIAGSLVVVGMTANLNVDRLDKYEDPPEKTVQELSLEKMDSSERGLEKADILSSVQISDSDRDGYMDFTLRGIDVRINNLSKESDLLRVDVTAWKDGEKLKVDNPYWFKNPPVKVPNGKFHRELIEGEEFDMPNMEYNPEAALQEILVQTLELQNNL